MDEVHIELEGGRVEGVGSAKNHFQNGALIFESEGLVTLFEAWALFKTKTHFVLIVIIIFVGLEGIPFIYCNNLYSGDWKSANSHSG